MDYQYRPSMKPYEALWERDGECVWSLSMLAANEQDVMAHVEAFLLRHPDVIPGGLQGTTVRVELLDLDELRRLYEDGPDA